MVRKCKYKHHDLDFMLMKANGIMKRIILGVTCFNNETEVVNFVKGIQRQSIDIVELIVSITCTNINTYNVLSSSIIDIKKPNLKIKVYNAEKNLGYLNACIYGIKKSLIEYKEADWIIISNTDIEFKENIFFEKLIKQSFSTDVWCVGPAIIDNTNQYRNPYIKTRPTKRSLMKMKFIYKCRLLNSIYFKAYQINKKIKEREYSNLKNSCYTYAIHGCIFIITFLCFKELEKISKGIFMYGEENLIGEIVYGNKKLTYYWADSLVYHNNSQVTSRISDKNKLKWKNDSIEFILEKFYEG